MTTTTGLVAAARRWWATIRREPFGWQTSITLYHCNPHQVTDPDHIAAFAAALVKTLDMRGYGDPLVDYFGEAAAKTAGHTLVQRLETSAAVAHFSDDRAAVYLDVFSCKRYDPKAVARFAAGWFSARRVRRRTRTRR